jgi:hypothetical protein
MRLLGGRRPSGREFVQSGDIQSRVLYLQEKAWQLGGVGELWGMIDPPLSQTVQDPLDAQDDVSICPMKVDDKSDEQEEESAEQLVAERDNTMPVDRPLCKPGVVFLPQS